MGSYFALFFDNWQVIHSNPLFRMSSVRFSRNPTEL